MQRVIACNLIKSNVGFACVYALVCLINNKQIPMHILNVL